MAASSSTLTDLSSSASSSNNNHNNPNNYFTMDGSSTFNNNPTDFFIPYHFNQPSDSSSYNWSTPSSYLIESSSTFGSSNCVIPNITENHKRFSVSRLMDHKESSSATNRPNSSETSSTDKSDGNL